MRFGTWARVTALVTGTDCEGIGAVAGGRGAEALSLRLWEGGERCGAMCVVDGMYRTDWRSLSPGFVCVYMSVYLSV